MTCIIGWIDKDRTYIGADSIGANSTSYTIRKDPKVFKTGPFLIGGTSSFRMLELLQFSFKPSKQNTNETDYRYMCTRFMDSLRVCLKAGGFTKINNNEEKGGCFLVAYRNGLYTIHDDFQISIDTECFATAGSGEYTSRAVLYAIKDIPWHPKIKIKRAMQATEAVLTSVKGPFRILSIHHKVKG